VIESDQPGEGIPTKKPELFLRLFVFVCLATSYAVTSCLAFDPALMREQTIIGSFTYFVGTAGVHARDIDGDNISEIFVADPMMWFMLKWEPERNTYVQEYFQENGTDLTDGRIIDLEIGDVDADGELDVIVLMKPNDLLFYDAKTGIFKGTQNLGISNVKGIATGDLDPAAGDEIAAINDQGLYVYHFGNSSPVWSLVGAGGIAIETGNIDSDPAIEIVYSAGTGGAGYVVDSVTRNFEHIFPGGFGDYLDVGDIDGDLKEEVVGAELWSGNYFAIDVDSETLKWSHTNNYNNSAIRVADIDGNGIGEVLLGDRWGNVRIIDGSSGNLLHQSTDPEPGVSFIDAGDVNGDCKKEVLSAAGFISSGPDRLFVTDPITGDLLWQNLESDGPMNSFAIGDIDADGETEIIRASEASDHYSRGSLVFVTDLHHQRDEYIPTAPTNWITLTRAMVLVQADADPQLEYVMNSSTAFSEQFSAFDGISHTAQWTSPIGDAEYINALVAGDVDGDSTVDVAVGTSSGSTGLFVRIFRSTDGALLWQSPSILNGDRVEDIRLIDIDNDGITEILALTSGDGLRIFNGITHAQEWYYPGTNFTALETGDVDGDNDPDILIGDFFGVLTGLDGISHSQLFQKDTGEGQIYAIRLADVDGDSVPEILLTQNHISFPSNYLEIFSSMDLSLLWQSELLPGWAGDSSSLYVTDADNDGLTEILVSTQHGIHVYEYASGGVDLVPPVFPGPVGIQSVSSPTCCPVLDLDWSLANDDASPPVGYNIYRDVTPGFTPSPANFLIHSSMTSYRDHNVSAGTQYYYIVRAADAVGNEDANLQIASGTPQSSLSITPITLPDGTVNHFYNQALNGAGGTPPYDFRLATDNLPPGLLISTAGVISGLPSSTGQYGFAIRVRDSAGCETFQGFVLLINPSNCPAIVLSPSTLPDAVVGQTYTQTIDATGGAPPYTFAVWSGSMPPGLTLDSSGLLSGSPTQSGNFNVSIVATDSMTCSGSQNYTIAVTCPTITISPDSLPSGNVGFLYDVTLTADGGSGVYTFFKSSGVLPPGLTLNASGSISGTPLVAGSFVFTVTASDSTGCSSSKPYTILVNGCLFCDDFEDGILATNWTYLKPSWSEAGGELVGAPVGRKATAIASPAFGGCTTCQVTTQITSAGGVGSGIWLLAWYTDKHNTVELIMNEQTDKWILKQRVNGKIVAKAKATVLISPNISYNAQLSFDGTTFHLTVDANNVINMPAASTPSGTIGFQVKLTTGRFGSIQIN
jgi:hypothetical protein